MLEPVSHDTKGKRLNFCFRLSLGCAIRKGSRKFRYFGNPTTVFLPLEVYRELHCPPDELSSIVDLGNVGRNRDYDRITP